MYILLNCQNSGRGSGSRSVGMLQGIVKQHKVWWFGHWEVLESA